MSDRSSFKIQRSILYPVPILMVLIASIAFNLSSAKETAGLTGILINLLLEISFVSVGWYFLKDQLKEDSENYISLLLVLVMLLSLFWEPINRYFFTSGRTFELMMMFSLKNTLLAMLAASHIRKFQYMMTWGSLFLLIFSITFKSTPATLFLFSIYLLLGLLWLASNYWNQFRNLLLLSNGKMKKKKLLIFIPIILISLTILSFTNTKSHLRVLQGFLNSAGGEGSSDEFAQDGTGDGELLVAGKYDIRTFAALEDAPFLSSDEPSLYDILSDTYEEEFDPNTKIDRAISLRTEDLITEEKELPESENINQRFSTSRKSEKKGDTTAEAIHSEAVLHVSGRTPLHLRMECYDLFDGVSWHREPENKEHFTFRLEEQNKEPWILLNNHGNFLTNDVKDELHVINNLKLKSNVLPTPLHFRKIHIDNLKKIDMLGWHQNSIPKMNRESLPRMVPIHIISRFPDTKSIHIKKTFYEDIESKNSYLLLPDHPVIQKLKLTAEQITQNAKSHSEILRIIESYHREKYLPDNSVTYIKDRTVPLEKFLEEGSTGPDYLIVTSAALMLRSLGFETRLVSGFYARPDKYDHESKHTPVHKDDVHFWLEIKVAPGHSSWITIEPSRGYEVLRPEPGLVDEIYYAFMFVINFIYRNTITVVIVLSVLVLAFLKRHTLLEWSATRWTQMFEPVDVRQFVLNTLWVTEIRLNNHGYARPASETFSSWVKQFNQLSINNLSTLEKLGNYLNWVVYSPDSQNCKDLRKLKEIRLLCRDVLNKRELIQDRDK